jgi:hypothetical protein
MSVVPDLHRCGGGGGGQRIIISLNSLLDMHRCGGGRHRIMVNVLTRSAPMEEDERENGYKRNSNRVREAHNECF